MKDRIYWIRSANKFLVVSGVLAISCAIVVRRLTPTHTQAMVMTTRQQTDYRYAMNQYHVHYGHFPAHCTNTVELARALGGENVNGDNPDSIKFFSHDMALKKRVLDGWGFPFELSVDSNGTNFILKSYGPKRYRETYRTNAIARTYNISALYTQTLAEAEAEARARIQTISVTVTNRPAIRKGTNHVNSTSQ